MPSLLGKVWTLAKWNYFKRTRDRITIPTRQGLLTVSTRDEAIGKLLYLHRQYQLDTTTKALEFLRTRNRLPPRGTGTLLDIGANIGIISIDLLGRGEFARSVGIEPDPTNFSLCLQNIRQNGLEERFRLIQAAVADMPGELQLELSPDNFGDHRVARGGTDAANRVTVRAERLDTLTEGMTDLALIWMDIQGYEGYAFLGGPQLFRSGVPVVTEIWPFGIRRAGMTVPQFCAILADMWTHFWVWENGSYQQKPVGELQSFCESLDRQNTFDDILLMG